MTPTSYSSLPALAGLCTAQDALKQGLSVEECVGRLKRYHYAFMRLYRIFTARITAEPVYELKMAYSYHAYLCSEHLSALRERVAEMREPPLGLEHVPDLNLEIFFDEIQSAPGSVALVSGLYGKALPALRRIRPDIRVVVSSGYSETETMTLFRGQKVSGFVQKPYTSKVIAEKVNTCLV